MSESQTKTVTQPAPDAVTVALAEYRQLALKVNGTSAMSGPKDLAFHVRRDTAARAAHAAQVKALELADLVATYSDGVRLNTCTERDLYDAVTAYRAAREAGK